MIDLDIASVSMFQYMSHYDWQLSKRIMIPPPLVTLEDPRLMSLLPDDTTGPA